LKRPVDLPEDDGDGRKKVAVSTLGERRPHMAIELDTTVESGVQDTTEGKYLNSASPKGKAKAKSGKRKSREALPCTPAGRVHTRSDTKKR
jgi:hypothetical protein